MENYILYIAGWYPSKEDTYSGDFVQRHAQCIAAYQKVITVFITKSKLYKTVTIQKEEKDNLIEYIVYYPARRMADKVWSHYFYTKLYKQLLSTIFSTYGKPKLVHAYIAWKAGIIALFIKRRYSIPYVLTDQSSAYYKADLNFIGKDKIRFSIVKKIFQNATALITISHIYYENCSALFDIKKPYFVIENCVDTNHFYLEQHSNPVPVFIHVSTMDYPKNMEGLLQAISNVTKVRNDFKVLLVGNIRKEVLEQIKLQELENQVTLTGVVPYTEVAALVRQSEAMLMFSRFEGLPCVILEGFCSGLPLISTDVGGIPEVVNSSNGVLVNEGDIQSMTNSILDFLNRKKEYNNETIGEDATNRYSYEAIGKKFIAAYNAILKQTTGS